MRRRRGKVGAITPLFPLGPITMKEEAALALRLAGQEFTFFVEKHAAGDWGEVDAAANERGLRDRTAVLSAYPHLAP